MKVIIPAAGIGTRLYPQTYTLPKALLPVAGKPMLGHILEGLLKYKVKEFFIVIGYLKEQVKKFVKRNYKFKVKFVVQDKLLGLGYAVYLALHKIKTGPVLIILGDTIIQANLSGVIRGKYDSIGVKKVSDPHRFGIVELENGFVKHLEEKPTLPKTNLAVVGVYFIKNIQLLKECLASLLENNIKTKDEFQLTDALELMIERGNKFTTFKIDKWFDCGTKEAILLANRELLKQASYNCKYRGSLIIPPVYVSPVARIENSIIGPYVSVSQKASISNCIIKDSIIGEGAVLTNSALENSVVGKKVKLQGQLQQLSL